MKVRKLVRIYNGRAAVYNVNISSRDQIVFKLAPVSTPTRDRYSVYIWLEDLGYTRYLVLEGETEMIPTRWWKLTE